MQNSKGEPANYEAYRCVDTNHLHNTKKNINNKIKYHVTQVLDNVENSKHQYHNLSYTWIDSISVGRVGRSQYGHIVNDNIADKRKRENKTRSVPYGTVSNRTSKSSALQCNGLEISTKKNILTVS